MASELCWASYDLFEGIQFTSVLCLRINPKSILLDSVHRRKSRSHTSRKSFTLHKRRQLEAMQCVSERMRMLVGGRRAGGLPRGVRGARLPPSPPALSPAHTRSHSAWLLAVYVSGKLTTCAVCVRVNLCTAFLKMCSFLACEAVRNVYL